MLIVAVHVCLPAWALTRRLGDMSRRLGDDRLGGDASSFAAARLSDARLGDGFSCVPHCRGLGFALPAGEECWRLGDFCQPLPLGLSTYSSSLPARWFRLGVGTFVPLSQMVRARGDSSADEASVDSLALAAARLTARWAVGDIGSDLTRFCSLPSSASSRASSTTCLVISSPLPTVLGVCVRARARAGMHWLRGTQQWSLGKSASGTLQ